MTPPPPKSTLFPYTTLFRSAAYYKLADAYSRAQKYEEAEKLLQRSIWLDATSTGPYILMGKVLEKKGEPLLAHQDVRARGRSEEHTSELQSQFHLVCRLLLE